MKSRRGYILLTVLLLLMLAAVVMASFCRLAIQRSLQATAATDELQRRWGTLSCRDVILPNAENLLEMDEFPASPVKQLHADFMLGAEQLTIHIGDEQAKANVNALYAIKGKDRAEKSIAMLAKVGGSRLITRLRLAAAIDVRSKVAPPTQTPNPQDTGDTATADNIPVVFGSWSEVFPDAQPSDLFPSSAGAVTDHLTCWGNGSLNLRRASVASITQMCSPILSPQQIAQLIALRSRLSDGAAIDQLLQAVHTTTRDSATLASRLTLTSAAHSLWITSRDHSQTQQSLFIQDGSNSDDVRSFAFQW